MSNKSREVIFGSRIRGAKIRAEGAREEAVKAVRAADRAEAAWSIRNGRYGGPAQPSPTITQCLNGGYGWLQVKCRRCETEASIPLEHVRRPRCARPSISGNVNVIGSKLKAKGNDADGRAAYRIGNSRPGNGAP